MAGRRIFQITETLCPISETHSHRRQGGHSTADYLTISCFAADFTNRSEAHLTSELPKQIPQRNLTTTNPHTTPTYLNRTCYNQQFAVASANNARRSGGIKTTNDPLVHYSVGGGIDVFSLTLCTSCSDLKDYNSRVG
jgi:hypothetical protein